MEVFTWPPVFGQNHDLLQQSKNAAAFSVFLPAGLIKPRSQTIKQWIERRDELTRLWERALLLPIHTVVAALPPLP